MIIYRIGKDLYALNYKDRKAMLFKGVEEIYHASKEAGISAEDLENCLSSFIKNEHNAGHFGSIAGTFIFSERI